MRSNPAREIQVFVFWELPTLTISLPQHRAGDLGSWSSMKIQYRTLQAQSLQLLGDFVKKAKVVVLPQGKDSTGRLL